MVGGVAHAVAVVTNVEPDHLDHWGTPEAYDADPEGAKQYARDWKARNRDRLPGYGRKHRHGITEAEYQSMVQAQDGLCAICGRDDGDLRVDHCHSRLVIRGLLCDRCNRGIGLLGDDSERLVRAAAYVNREGVMPHARDHS